MCIRDSSLYRVNQADDRPVTDAARAAQKLELRDRSEHSTARNTRAQARIK